MPTPLASRVENLYLRPSADPTGNGQPASELVYRKADGTVASLRVFVYEHAGQKLRLMVHNGADESVTDTNPVNGQIVVSFA